MRNNSKITTLESKFPLLSIEQGCMVSKDADITVAFRVELPELFTVTSTEYEAMHSAWHKAIKVLPNYSIVHKQDWFIKENYQGKLADGGLSFLARSSERHFNERPYLHHSVYLFLTKTNKQRMAQQSNFSSLCRGHLLPKEITNKDEVMKFMEAVDQFERIINDTEQLRIVRMTEEELIGTKKKGGLLDRYRGIDRYKEKRRSLGPLFLPLGRRTRFFGGHPSGCRPCACGRQYALLTYIKRYR